MYKIKTILFFLLLFFGGNGFLVAQQAPKKPVPKAVAPKAVAPKAVASKKPTSKKPPQAPIALAIRPYKDSMALRFYPTSYEVWQKSRTMGFNVYRTLVKDGKPQGEALKINDEPILPISLEVFRAKYSNDKNAQKAVMLVAPSENDKPDANIATAIERNKNEEFMFAVALLSANTYPIAAKLGGMTFSDKNVTLGNTYSYQIVLSDKSFSSNFTVATAGQTYEIPKILDFLGKSRRQVASLQWLNQKNDISFAYYDLYRSTQPDGGFKKVNADPILPLYNEFTPKGMLEFMDTLPRVDIPFYYKLQAFTPFGEASEFSKVVMIRSGQSLYNAPTITSLMAVENKSIMIAWNQEDERTMKNTTGYMVLRTTDPTSGIYTKLTPLPIMNNTFEDKTPLKSAFYRVLAVGIAGDTAYSPHKSVSLIDSTPPPRPVLAYAKADSNKIVTLRWHPSKADDLMGYRILRANALDEEYVRLTVGVQADTFLIDTISPKLGYRSVYYKVYAMDFHDNSTPIYKPTEVKFPDLSPPYPPQIVKLAEGIDTIAISWIPSLSKDVVKCQLLRKERYEPTWKVLRSWSKDSLNNFKSYIDTNVAAGNIYQYWVKAIDEVGLSSSQSAVVQASPLRNTKVSPVKDFKGIVSTANNFIKLSWNYDSKELLGFSIYRKVAGGIPNLLCTLKANEREYYDKNVAPGTIYLYYIQADMKNFIRSPLSPPLEVKY